MERLPSPLVLTLLASVLILLLLIIPAASASDDYLDGGFLGVPKWVYDRWSDPSLISGVIGGGNGGTIPRLSRGYYTRKEPVQPAMPLSPFRYWRYPSFRVFSP